MPGIPSDPNARTQDWIVRFESAANAIESDLNAGRLPPGVDLILLQATVRSYRQIAADLRASLDQPLNTHEPNRV